MNILIKEKFSMVIKIPPFFVRLDSKRVVYHYTQRILSIVPDADEQIISLSCLK